MLERLNPCDNRNCLCEFMQAGFRPGEGYFEDIADLIALAAKILYSRVLNWIKRFRKKKLINRQLIGAAFSNSESLNSFFFGVHSPPPISVTPKVPNTTRD